jgi:tyrosyl-tRNA synthetase
VSDEELGEFRQQLKSGSINPMILKKRLGREIVAQFHRAGAAQKAEADFEKEVQLREVPEKISVRFSIKGADYNSGGRDYGTPSIIDVLDATGVVKSRSEARRLISQSAVDIVHPDGTREVVSKDRDAVAVGDRIKVGSRRWIEIVE